MGQLITIDDFNYSQYIDHYDSFTGEKKSKGLNPRDYSIRPVGYLGALAQPFPDSLLIPESEWDDRIAEQEANKSSLQHIRDKGNYGQRIPSYDQDGKGYCLPSGQLVSMSDGGQKPIEEVRLGEFVNTASGEAKEVCQTHQRLYTGEMVGISVQGLERPLIVTADHKVLTVLHWGCMDAGGWRAASEIDRGRMVYAGRCDGSLARNVRFVKKCQERRLRVYDIGVDGDENHTFVANGVIVHNCWAHSSTSAVTLVRAFNNQPYVPLSAFAVACIIKGFQDEGGWGSESLEFIASRGIPSSQFWPMQSMSRNNDNTQTWENAKLHVCQEWWDLSNDSATVRKQLATCLLLNIPVVVDMNWWSHSICAVRLVKRDPFTIRIWNSWSDTWSDGGMGDLTGSKAIPDGAVAPRVMTASVT